MWARGKCHNKTYANWVVRANELIFLEAYEGKRIILMTQYKRKWTRV